MDGRIEDKLLSFNGLKGGINGLQPLSQGGICLINPIPWNFPPGASDASAPLIGADSCCVSG
jgi:hypothetical protein